MKDDSNFRDALPSTPQKGTLPSWYSWKRFNCAAGRQMIRIGTLFTYFGANLVECGWLPAICSSWTQLIRPYAKFRTAYIMQQTAWIGRTLAQRIGKTSSKRSDQPVKQGVLFVGYAEGALGLGQALRANLQAAASAGIDFSIFPFKKNIENRRIAPFMKERYDTENTYDINIIQVATDQIPYIIDEIGQKSLEKSYNILCTYWELSKTPREWKELLENIHEIWAPTKFIAESFSKIFEKKITIMPPAINFIAQRTVDKSKFNMKNDNFYFIFSFDYYSSPYRKNPLGVLEAFEKAFPLKTEPVGLIIKSTGTASTASEINATIHAACQRDERIIHLDKNLSRNEMEDLLLAVDVYVSLHRAEGFGLGMAEALAIGKIVIGTDYSGSTDFLSLETGYPVPYKLRPVAPHEYPWAIGQVWAEPDLNVAAGLMQSVFELRNTRNLKSISGKNFVRNKYGIKIVGVRMRDRIKEIRKDINKNMNTSAITSNAFYSSE